jgi:hypothetical protein
LSQPHYRRPWRQIGFHPAAERSFRHEGPIAAGNTSALNEAVAGIDVPTMINSAFNLAVGVVLSLSEELNQSVLASITFLIDAVRREM